MPTRRLFVAQLTATAMFALPPAAAISAPVTYQLQTDKSEVGFIFTLNQAEARGSMPVQSARIVIDPTALTRSSVDVTVSARQARTGLFFATEALKSSSVLDTSNHPTIRFTSKRIRLGGAGRLSDGAKIDGDLTIRGVTRPVTLEAALFRQRGTDPGDLSRLSFRLKGVVDRRQFGVNGYPKLVDDLIRIDITARVKR